MTSSPVELGRGRFPASEAKKYPRQFKLMTCSECQREYSIKKGKDKKEYLTCSPDCSTARQNKARVDYNKKKVIGLYLDVPIYEKLEGKAQQKKRKVAAYIRDLILKDLGKKKPRAGKKT